MKAPENRKSRPGGRLDEHVGTHVFYRMMMMAAHCWFDIAVH
jgi:hypothetical protein